MSYYSTDSRESGIKPADIISVLLIVVLAVAASWYMMGQRDYPLRQSAMGHVGLIAWLRDQGLEAREARGLTVTPDKVGMRILAIHDTDLARAFAAPADKADYLATGTEYDIRASTVLQKINLLPSVIIAPKWSRAARHSGYADASLLLPVDVASRPFLQLNVMEKPFQRPTPKLLEMSAPSTVDGPAQSVTLYSPQLFHRDVPEGCTSLLGGAIGHLIIECEGHNRSFIAISDPDFLNNHGLALGQNAAIAATMIGQWANELPVIVDTTTRLFTEDTLPELPQRAWTDLLRLFSYPFTILWAAAGMVLALALWRSWYRFGPPIPAFVDGLGASKATSIEAKARLLRLTGNDTALFETYIAARIRALEEAIFGINTVAADPVRRIFTLLEGRNHELAIDFGKATAAAQTPTPGTPETGLLDLAEQFERQTERVLNELGRSSQGG